MSDRVEIPPELATKVLFASDRRCCICRDDNTKVQIHHIDNDPSNNSFENLAVICLDHHSDAHSKDAFVRNLTPGLIAEYNATWRSLVKARLAPGGDSDGALEFISEALLEFTLNCHAWKIQYMMMYPGSFREVDGSAFTDVWDMMLEMGQHPYNQSAWESWRPLFTDGIRHLLAAFDRALALYSGVLPAKFKTMIIRTRRRLDTTQRVYLYLPTIIARPEVGSMDASMLFKHQFVDALQAIRDIDREAGRLRDAATGAS